MQALMIPQLVTQHHFKATKPGSTVVRKLNSKTVAIWPSFDGNGVFASFFAGKKMRENATHTTFVTPEGSLKTMRAHVSIDALQTGHKRA